MDFLCPICDKRMYKWSNLHFTCGGIYYRYQKIGSHNIQFYKYNKYVLYVARTPTHRISMANGDNDDDRYISVYTNESYNGGGTVFDIPYFDFKHDDVKSIINKAKKLMMLQ